MSVRISESTLHIFNPATKENISSIPITSESELQTILNNAKEAASNYNYSDFFYRQKLMKKFQKGIVQHMDDFIDIICNETGKKEIESIMEVFISLEHLRQSTRHLYESLGRRYRRAGVLKTKKAWIEYEALGVAGIISPWNYPLILTMSPIVEAILAGNTVVLKPSEHTPLTTHLLKKIWDETTESPNIFQPVYGDGQIGSALVKSDQTDVICFTGSTIIGRKIAETCATLFKPVILELGGKDPMIILKDADVDRSIEAALWGGLSNSGQTCISVEHIYVQEEIFIQVVEKLTNELKQISAGLGEKDLGTISIEESMKKIRNMISETMEQSEVIQGQADEGWFIPPTLVISPPFESQIMKEETFGPVMTIHSFKNDDEAIKLANMTGYGLSASIFGKNSKRLKSISRRIKVGTISINDVLTHYGIADLPFGGMGLSGMGKVHGKEGLRAFSCQKSYLSNRISFKSEYWWFKKRKKIGKLLKKWIKWQYS